MLVIKPKSVKTGIAFGFSSLAMFIAYAVMFYVGAIFHRDKGVDLIDMYTTNFALMYAAFGAGNNN